VHASLFLFIGKHHQKVMDKNGLQNSLKEFFKNKNKITILPKKDKDCLPFRAQLVRPCACSNHVI
jgi:hypothetical protein